MKILVIGGGISGLTSVLRLNEKYPSAEVDLAETSNRLGGQLYTYDGVDIGGEAFITRRPEVIDMLEKLGIADAMRYPDPQYSPKIWCDGQLMPVPARSYMGIPGDKKELLRYLSLDEQKELLAKRDVQLRWRSGEDITIYDYLTHFFTPAAIHKVIDPFITGVYAAPSKYISLRYSMPAVAQKLDYGMRVNSQIISAIVSDPTSYNKKPIFASLAGGYQVLISALAQQLHCAKKPKVDNIIRDKTGYTVYFGDNTVQSYSAVVVATTPGPAAKILQSCAVEASGILSRVATSSPVVVQVRTTENLPECTGVLIPDNAPNIRTKAVTFTAQKWPHMRSTGAFRLSYGRYDDFLQTNSCQYSSPITPEAYQQYAKNDFYQLTGNQLDNSTMKVQYWNHTLPVITPSNYRELRIISETLPANLVVTGAYLGGVGVPACIACAHEQVETIEL